MDASEVYIFWPLKLKKKPQQPYSIQVKIWFQNRRMKWKRSRKAKEQAGASAQSDMQRLRGEGKTSAEKPDESRRAAGAEERGTDLDLEDGEERDEDDEDEEDDVEEQEEEAQHGFPVGMPRSTDYMQCGTDAGYPHSPYTDEELEGIQVGGGDRKIRAGL